MELNVLEKIMESLKPGVYANIVYNVECPVKAEFKKQGIRVKKMVSMTARFKINYNNIAKVKLARELKGDVVPAKKKN